MLKKLLIAEKPSVAATIAKVLGVNNIKDGYIEGDDYIVSWAVGHLVSTSYPEKYDKKYKNWNLNDLPIIPGIWKYEISRKTSKQFNILKTLFNRSDVERIICATDAGREGELIFRLIKNKIGSKKPAERLWVSSLEEKAIKEAMKNLKPLEQYDNLYKAADCRNKSDWLIGMNYSRLFSIISNETFRVGRVQTPTLNMIVEREKEINLFNSRKYKVIEIEIKKDNDKFKAISSELSDINKSLEALNNGIFVKKVVTKNKLTNPPLPFDLTTLQRSANKIFGYSAKKTLNIAQNLYESKNISYPRTDSRYITNDMIGTIEEIIDAFKLEKHYKKENIKRIADDSKVTDHTCILPTLTSIKTSKKLKGEDLNIYNLITIQLLLSVCNSKKSITTKIDIGVNDDDTIYKANGEVVLDPGFKEIETFCMQKQLNIKANKKEEISIPNLKEGEKLHLISKKVVERQTQPPSYFTEDSLLKAMELAGNEMLDKTVNIERKGIGTPATRADVIEGLIKAKYITRKNKKLRPTILGEKLISLVPERIKSPKLTADWENKLAKISSGDYMANQFMDDIKKDVKHTCNEFRNYKIKGDDNMKDVGSCPLCGSRVNMSDTGVNCENSFYGKNKGDCQFSFYRTVNGHYLTDDEVEELMTAGFIDDIEFVSKKTGNEYTTRLVLDPHGQYKVRMDFNN
ncbi:MAG: DNA topoisomerase 3 [Tissierellia bacterium]|nr:DNA topoisomerase 3 [Tissierellia bacterium]